MVRHGSFAAAVRQPCRLCTHCRQTARSSLVESCSVDRSVIGRLVGPSVDRSIAHFHTVVSSAFFSALCISEEHSFIRLCHISSCLMDFLSITVIRDVFCICRDIETRFCQLFLANLAFWTRLPKRFFALFYLLSITCFIVTPQSVQGGAQKPGPFNFIVCNVCTTWKTQILKHLIRCSRISIRHVDRSACLNN